MSGRSDEDTEAVEAVEAAMRQGPEALAARNAQDRKKSVTMVRKIGFGAVGGLVLIAGIVMMIGPGPGPLVIVLGLFILGQEFEWAAKRLDEAKAKALGAAHKTASSPMNTAAGLLGAAALIGGGIYWGLNDDLPFSSWITAGTVIFSGVIAAGTVVWAVRDLRKQKAAKPS